MFQGSTNSPSAIALVKKERDVVRRSQPGMIRAGKFSKYLLVLLRRVEIVKVRKYIYKIWHVCLSCQEILLLWWAAEWIFPALDDNFTVYHGLVMWSWRWKILTWVKRKKHFTLKNPNPFLSWRQWSNNSWIHLKTGFLWNVYLSLCP